MQKRAKSEAFFSCRLNYGEAEAEEEAEAEDCGPWTVDFGFSL
jgi:hypothetical protein